MMTDLATGAGPVLQGFGDSGTASNGFTMNGFPSHRVQIVSIDGVKLDVSYESGIRGR